MKCHGAIRIKYVSFIVGRRKKLVIELEHVTKEYKVPCKGKNFFTDLFSTKYKYITAVDDVSLKIEKGETVGYIGLNGAGKSTTIKMMTGILTPTKGNVFMFGDSVRHNRIQKNKRFSVVFGQRSNLWYDLPVIDSYKYFEVLYEVPKLRFEENLKRISTLLEIEDLLNTPVRKLSLGQKMKCELGGALLHDPEILFLDEPTIGLDIFAKDNFLRCIRQINEELNTTIFLTSHDMEEIEKLCKRIIVLDKGKILFDGKIEEIKKNVGDYHKVKFYIEEYDASRDIYKEYQKKESNDGILELIIDKNKLSLAEIVNYYFQNFKVKDIAMANNGLEQLIKELYEGKGK